MMPLQPLGPVLEVLGSTVHHCGSLGAGQMAKAANQIVVAAVLVGLGEALVFAEAAGLEMELILDILSGGLAGSKALEVKREKLLSGRFEPGGAASAQLKDLRFALDEARLLEVSLNLTPVCEGLYAILCRMGGSELDHAAVVDVIRMLSSRVEPSGNHAPMIRLTASLSFLFRGGRRGRSSGCDHEPAPSRLLRGRRLATDAALLVLESGPLAFFEIAFTRTPSVRSAPDPIRPVLPTRGSWLRSH